MEIVKKYITTRIVPTPDTKKVAVAPNWYQINPANELANIVQMLWNPENVPMAVAVSSFFVMFEIQALEIPSVAEAYNPYIKNSIKNRYIFVLTDIPKYTTANNTNPVIKIVFNPTLSARIPTGNENNE